MAALTTLDILYIVLIIFTTIIGTLLTIVLYKVIKILNPVLEMVGYYNQIKQYISSYKAIPQIIKDKVLEYIDSLKSTKKETKKEVVEKEENNDKKDKNKV